jgi:hypothetical protein
MRVYPVPAGSRLGFYSFRDSMLHTARIALCVSVAGAAQITAPFSRDARNDPGTQPADEASIF